MVTYPKVQSHEHPHDPRYLTKHNHDNNHDDNTSRPRHKQRYSIRQLMSLIFTNNYGQKEDVHASILTHATRRGLDCLSRVVVNIGTF